MDLTLRSVRQTVRLRGKPCSLKRHFHGCLKQVAGYLEKLAALDDQRFVYPSMTAIQRQAVNWRDQKQEGGAYERKNYKERWVRVAVRTLENLGVIIPAERTRSGRRLRGWFVVQHKTSSHMQTCFLPLTAGLKPLTAGLTAGLNAGPEASDCRFDCRSDESEVSQAQQVNEGGSEVLPEVLPAGAFKSPLDPCFSASEKRSIKAREPVRGANPGVPVHTGEEQKKAKPGNAAFEGVLTGMDWAGWKGFAKGSGPLKEGMIALVYGLYRTQASREGAGTVMTLAEFRGKLEGEPL